MDIQNQKNRWWLWLLPSVILMPLSLFSASSDSFVLPITLSAVAGILVSVGFSKVLAGEARWWAVLIVYFIFTLIIAFPLRQSGIREAALIGDFIAMCILGCVFGIPIVNAYRRKPKVIKVIKQKKQKRKLSRLGIAAIVIACICVIGGSTWFALSNLLKPSYLQVGDKHTDFTLKGIDANSYSLKQFLGKNTLLLYEWRNCTGSELEMPFVEMAYKNIRNNVNVAIIFGTGDDIIRISDYVNSKKWTLSPILIDEDDAVYKQYGLPNIRPMHVLLDSSGVIKKVQPGPFKSPADVENWLGLSPSGKMTQTPVQIMDEKICFLSNGRTITRMNPDGTSTDNSSLVLRGGVTWTNGGSSIYSIEQLEDQNYIQKSVGRLDDIMVSRTEIFKTRNEIHNPQMSPDGKILAFTTGADTNALDIYLLDTTSNQITRLTTDVGFVHDQGIHWSPDSKKVAFVFRKHGMEGIHVFKIDDGITHIKQIKDASSPDWISNNIIGYWNEKQSHALIADNLNPLDDILLNKIKYKDNTYWSKDGQKIAFESAYITGLHISDKDGLQVKRLTEYTGYSFIEWSPDNTFISLVPDKSNKGLIEGEIYIANIKDNTIIQITDKAKVTKVSWSFDSRKIVFVSESSQNTGQKGVYILNADGTGYKKISEQYGSDLQVFWQKIYKTN